MAAATAKVVRIQSPLGEDIELRDTTQMMQVLQKELAKPHIEMKKLADRAELCLSTVSRIRYAETSSPRWMTCLKLFHVLGFTIYARR